MTGKEFRDESGKMPRADARLMLLAAIVWLATVVWLFDSAGCSSAMPC